MVSALSASDRSLRSRTWLIGRSPEEDLARVPGGAVVGCFEDRQQIAVGADGFGHTARRWIRRYPVAESQKLSAVFLHGNGQEIGQRVGGGPDVLTPLAGEESHLQHRQRNGLLQAEGPGAGPLQGRQVGAGADGL